MKPFMNLKEIRLLASLDGMRAGTNAFLVIHPVDAAALVAEIDAEALAANKRGHEAGKEGREPYFIVEPEAE